MLVLNHLRVPVSRDLFEFAGFGWSIRDFAPPLLELTNAVMKQDRKNRVAKMIMDFEFSASLLITCVDMPVAMAVTIILVTAGLLRLIELENHDQPFDRDPTWTNQFRHKQTSNLYWSNIPLVQTG